MSDPSTFISTVPELFEPSNKPNEVFPVLKQRNLSLPQSSVIKVMLKFRSPLKRLPKISSTVSIKYESSIIRKKAILQNKRLGRGKELLMGLSVSTLRGQRCPQNT